MKKLLILCCFWALVPLLLKAQSQFDVERLHSPTEYGPVVAQSIHTLETPVYQPDSASTLVFLPNGLNSSSYQDPSEWTNRKDSLIPFQVDVVFSKFPLIDGVYQMKYPLLCNRLIKLFNIDPALNNSQLKWRIVLQTDCPTEEKVRSLFHGVVIHCRKVNGQGNGTSETVTKEESESVSEFARTSVTSSLVTVTEVPEEVQEQMEGKSEEERREILLSYYQNQIELSPEDGDTTSLDTYLEESQEMIEDFIEYYSYGSTDNTVIEVLNRNDWENAMVVADWTGSMYRYGAHVLLWHSLHYRKSKIGSITLFNDGNMTRNPDKVVGNTGGIYHAEANKLKGIMDLYRFVMLRGSGGDLPENDLEAVIAGLERFPDHGDVVLVADNRACVRDIALLDSIDVPVHVILCGIGRKKAINPQYLQIAAATGGSVHTLNSDIKNLVFGSDGKVSLPQGTADSLTVSKNPCDLFASMYPPGYFDNKLFESFKETKGKTKSVINLSLSDEGLKRVPRKLKHFDKLKSVDLSNNQIDGLNKVLFRLPELEILDLKGNQLTEVSEYFINLKTLKRLDLSDNRIDTLGRHIVKCRELTHLNLADNEIAYLPKNFYYRSLQSLDLGGNEINTLPNGFYRMRTVTAVDLSDNDLKSIAPLIGSMRRLRTLNLADNDLEELPKSLARLKKLEYLDLSGNDLSPEYVEWLRSRLVNTTIVFQ